MAVARAGPVLDEAPELTAGGSGRSVRPENRRSTSDSRPRLAGVKASNHMKLVMDGKRGLPEATARRYAQAMGLHGDEMEYFCDLARFNQAASQGERSALYRRLTGFRGYRDVQRLELEHAAYHANWYIPAIRELAARPDFVDDPAWIAAQLVPPISKADVKRAKKLLGR